MRGRAESRSGLLIFPLVLRLALLLQGRSVSGFGEIRKVYDQIRKPLVVGGVSLMYGLFQRTKKARQLLAELQEMSGRANVPPMAFAYAYLDSATTAFSSGWTGRSTPAIPPPPICRRCRSSTASATTQGSRRSWPG